MECEICAQFDLVMTKKTTQYFIISIEVINRDYIALEFKSICSKQLEHLHFDAKVGGFEMTIV